jgi:hypothetical protein
MRVIIAGSRGIDEYNTVESAISEFREGLNDGIEITEVVSGGASGVDSFGERWAYENSVPMMPFDVTEEMYSEYGKVAPKMRNSRMAEYADALLAIWDGSSSGTKDMIDKAEKEDLLVHVTNTGTTLGDFE